MMHVTIYIQMYVNCFLNQQLPLFQRKYTLSPHIYIEALDHYR